MLFFFFAFFLLFFCFFVLFCCFNSRPSDGLLLLIAQGIVLAKVVIDFRTCSPL